MNDSYPNQGAIPWWEQREGNGPVIAAAIHNGHFVPFDISARMAVSEDVRLQEEDPYTAEWTSVAPNRLVVRRSRFFTDLNRPQEKSVYLGPDDAWGLEIWKQLPPLELIRELQACHSLFYSEMKEWFSQMEERWGRFVILDFHAYNHRRGGPSAPPANHKENPEINIGTGTMNRALWGSLIDRFIGDLKNCDFMGRQLDVRENVKFMGGEFPRWTHVNFPASACVLSIEVKKFFMDEWTGALYPDQFDALGRVFHSAVPGIVEELNKLNT